MSVRIDYEAALIEHDDCAAFEGERGDCINLDDMKAIMDAALPGDDMFTIDLPGSFDIGANDSWEELFKELIDGGLLVKVERSTS